MDIYTELLDSRIRRVKDGEVIITEDSWPYYVYVLKDGKARVLKNIDGRQVLIGTLTKGDTFGEIDCLGRTKRTVSVVADGDVIVEMITRDTFMDFVNKLPRHVQIKLYTMVSDLMNITEIYSRLVVLLRDMNAKTKMLGAETAGIEDTKTPEFMRHVITAMDRRYSIAVEGINKLSFQLGEQQRGRLDN
jgi:CRP-like cAMP-binding protein